MPSLRFSFMAGLIVGAGFGLILLSLMVFFWSRSDRRSNLRVRRSLAVPATFFGVIALAWVFATMGPMLRSRLREPMALLGLAILIAGIILTLTMLFARRLDAHGRKVLHLTALTVFILGLLTGGWMLYVKSVPGGIEDAIILERPPFNGSWWVTSGGRSRLTNRFVDNDHREPAHRYSVFMIHAHVEDTDVYDQGVYAPFDAKVVGPLPSDPGPNDKIVLQNGAGKNLEIRNIDPRSISKSVGETVRLGERIGKYKSYYWGNRPGLRMHAEKDGRPLSILIGPERIFPIRGDVIAFEDREK
ncbi:MAG: hypothetical protein ACOC2L_00525 [Candidatus Sumerlaeota bacterium]